MLAFDGTIGALVVPRDVGDVDAEDPAQVPPEIGQEGIPVVADDGVTSSIAAEPSSDEGVAA